MTAWWTSEKIKATLNQGYVERELGPKKHQDTLHSVLAFGNGLTDDTYLDWILERSSRFFLILNDIGVPDKIFEIIDRSFDDDDLPLTQDALWELNLFGTTSETLDKKFYRQQYYYLVQELEAGGHVDYGSWEVVPVQIVAKRAGILANQNTDKVIVHDRSYTRKRFPNSGDNGIDRIRFIMHLKNLAAAQHKHLGTVWASYSQDDFNYMLLTPCLDITLKSIFDDQSKQMKNLEKHERRQTLLTWTQCIASALAFLHNEGLIHKAIRPSTITVDHNFNIHLNDFDALKVIDSEEGSNPYSGELYDYAPPENWLRKSCLHEITPAKPRPPGGGRTPRRMPRSPPEDPGPIPSPSPHPESLRRTSSKSQSSSSASATSTNPRTRPAVITTFAPFHRSMSALPDKYFPSDVFSLTAVLLTLLSYILGHTPKSFASHRSRLNRQAGRGNATPDSSFHKNMKQVEKWIDTLAKEAGQKEKKDLKYWGAVVELAGLCRLGIQKEPNARISASELAKKTGGWVDWGIGRGRKCNCTDKDGEQLYDGTADADPTSQLNARRDSSWSAISMKFSGSGWIPPQSNLRPSRSLSQRKSYDRGSKYHRSDHRWTDSLRNSNTTCSHRGSTSRQTSVSASLPLSPGAHETIFEDPTSEHLFGKPPTPDMDHKLERPPQEMGRETLCGQPNSRDIKQDFGRAIPLVDEFDAMSLTSCGETEVWGLGPALEDEEIKDVNWPLPLGTLAFENHVR